MKYDPILEEIQKQMGKQKEEMLLMKRPMDGSDSMSNASTRSSSSGGSGGTFQKNWQPGFFKVNLSPFGSGKGKMLTMAEANTLAVEMQEWVTEDLRSAVDWKQYTKKTNKEGKIHTLIFYKATQTGGRVLEEITAMVNLQFQAKIDHVDFVAKSEVHPARAQRTKALFTIIIRLYNLFTILDQIIASFY